MVNHFSTKFPKVLFESLCSLGNVWRLEQAHIILSTDLTDKVRYVAIEFLPQSVYNFRQCSRGDSDQKAQDKNRKFRQKPGAFVSKQSPGLLLSLHKSPIQNDESGNEIPSRVALKLNGKKFKMAATKIRNFRIAGKYPCRWCLASHCRGAVFWHFFSKKIQSWLAKALLLDLKRFKEILLHKRNCFSFFFFFFK